MESSAKKKQEKLKLFWKFKQIKLLRFDEFYCATEKNAKQEESFVLG